MARKTYPPEFKLQAVKTSLEQKLAVAEVARRLGVSENLLHTWKKAVLENGTSAFPGSGHTYIGHARTVNAVAFAPSGDRLASGGGEWAVMLWSAAER